MKTITKTLVLSVVVSLPVLAGFIFWAPLASAATITVDTTTGEDSEPALGDGCSLYEAFEASDTDTAYGGCTTGSGADTITIPAGAYSLTGFIPEIETSVTVLGDPDGGTIFENERLSININLNNQTFLLRNITVRNSRSTGIEISGGQADDYEVNLDRVTIEDGDSLGLGHYRATFGSGVVNITNSLIQNNGNFGVYNDECGTVGSIHITNSIIRDNDDTGVFNTCGFIELNRVTITGNTANGANAGGVHNDAGGDGVSVMELTNTTVFGNVSPSGAGGIANTGSSMTMTNVTAADNEGFSIGGVEATASTTSYNTLIANNTGAQCNDDFSDYTAGDDQNNMATDGSCSQNIDDFFETISDAMLSDTLSDNGGSAPVGSGGLGGNVLTLALLEGSPAIDAGNDDYCPDTDERDADRPDGGACDVGAYESPFGTPATTDDEADEETLADTGTNTTIIALIGGTLLLIGSIGFIKTHQI